MATNEQEILRYSVPVTPELDAEVRRRMQEGGFSSIAEYVRTALRTDLEQARKDQLEKLLLEGLASGHGAEITPEYWEERRRVLNARLAKRKGAG